MPNTDTIDNLIKQLSHKNKAIRHEAEAELFQRSHEVLPSLIQSLQAEWEKYLRRDYQYRRILDKIEIVSMATSVIFLCIFFGSNQQIFPTFLGVFFILLLIPMAILDKMGKRTPTQLKSIYNILTKMKSPQMVGMILEMHATDHVWMSRNAIELLTLHIQQTLPSEWDAFNPSQKKAFYRITAGCGVVRQPWCQEFTLSSLKTIEQIGDAQALPTVKRIAKKGKTEKVRQAARECLPYLQVRREELTKRETLLRASESTSGKDELLRVPAQIHLSESDQLLRVPEE